MIQEVQTLPEDELQARAIAILKAKNHLTADDAKQVEEAFSARMTPQVASLGAMEGPTPIPTDSGTPLATTGAKRPRGRLRTVVTATNQSTTHLVQSQATIHEDASVDPAPAKIDKSKLTISEPRRFRDKAHLRFVALQPCLLCGRSPSDAHHLRFAQPRALGRKTSDEFVVPLCRIHHRQNHGVGDERAWWQSTAIDPLEVALKLWTCSRGGITDTSLQFSS